MAKNKKTRQNKCENTITQTARQKQYIKTKMAKKYKDAKSEKTMVNKLFNAALQLASYRKSKTQYKPHCIDTCKKDWLQSQIQLLDTLCTVC